MKRATAHRKSPRAGSDRLFDTVNLGILFIVLLTIVYPLLYIVSASFSDPGAVVSGKMMLWPVGFNLEAYYRVFTHSDIWRSYLNSLFYQWRLDGSSVAIWTEIPSKLKLTEFQM